MKVHRMPDPPKEPGGPKPKVTTTEEKPVKPKK
jgi:hypothetical protein